MQTNIFAYTAPESIFPAYVSLNERDGFPVLTVRGPRVGDASGETVEVPIPHHDLLRLFDALRERITPPLMKAMGQAI